MIKKGNVTRMLACWEQKALVGKNNRKETERKWENMFVTLTNIHCMCRPMSVWEREDLHCVWMWVSTHQALRWGHCSAMQLHSSSARHIFPMSLGVSACVCYVHACNFNSHTYTCPVGPLVHTCPVTLNKHKHKKLEDREFSKLPFLPFFFSVRQHKHNVSV